MARKRGSDTSADDYHHYHTLTFRASEQNYDVVTKPGIEHWDHLDPATELLIEVMQVSPADRVLDLGCGVGLVGLAAASRAPEGRVILLDRNVIAVEAARRTLALNGVSNAETGLSECGSSVHGQLFDIAAVHAPREKAVTQQCVRDAAALLRPGGHCYLAGANRSGVKSAIRYLEDVFGQAHLLAYRGGCRAAVATKSESTSIDQSATQAYYRFRELSADVQGKRYVCVTKPGIFSWERADEGTLRLVENMEVQPEDRVLDLGCGYGLAGLVAADRASRGEVVLADADCVAVEATRRTLEWNHIAHARVVLSDCGAALLQPRGGDDMPGAEAFDVVVTNPPFHQGRGVSYSVALQFIRDAAELLRPGGRLYLVANRFIPYGQEMNRLFEQVDFAYRDSRFQVWRAVKG